MKVGRLALLGFTLLGLGIGAPAFGQTGPSPRERGEGAPVGRTFEDGFWRYLREAAPAYRTWGPWPGQDGDFYPGESPHGDLLKMYLNRTAASDPDGLPNGSILVKENYAADRRTLLAVTVMYRVENFDPVHGDWYWMKYNANGSIAKQDGRKLAGKVASCIECHSKAKGEDFVFTND